MVVYPVIFVTIVFIIGTPVDADPIVQLPTGQIKGRQNLTFQGNVYYAFEAVPYAGPPIGKLRFMAPQPPEPWNDIRDCTRRKIVCYQRKLYSHESEDCLLANIYTTALPSEGGTTSLLPVMLFIHGGGFVTGNTGQAAENLLDNGVLVVTIEYRLGPFGFLSTEDEIIPGNNGLKDQQRAIQWTYENIHLFGGDRNKITIFGQSAGSASVAYQLLNRGIEGMIAGAICESGSALSPWAYQRRAREIAFSTGAILNETFLTNDNSQDLLEFLQSVEAKDLDDAAERYYNETENPQDFELSQGYYWAPVVEAKNPDGFLTKKMFGLLKAGNFIGVPVLMGINSEEMLFTQSNRDQLKETMAIYDEHLDWLVPNDMLITDEDERLELGSSIKNIYTGGEPLPDHLGDGVRFYSDNSFTRSVIKFAELASQFTAIYFYQFSYDGQVGGYGIYYEGAEHVSHNEEMKYIFGNTDYGDYPEADQLTHRRLMKIWTDFAKYQNPTPEASELLQNITWPLVDTKNGDYLFVDINTGLEIKNYPKEETYKAWNKLYESLGYDDFDTY